MRIVIAPNAFKNALDAASVADAIDAGLRQSSLDCETVLFPVGDGGDGTGQLLAKALNAESRACMAHDPFGRPMAASYGWVPASSTAVIEMADASGLRLLKPQDLDPLRASSYGTGEMMKDAIAFGAQHIILCIGGSATVDAGCGIAAALRAVFLDRNNKAVDPLPQNLVQVTAIDFSGFRSCKCTLLCDVKNPLLGPDGAAAVFGPQKGASAEAVTRLEAGLAHLNELLKKELGLDVSGLQHGGAAGGTAAGLHALLGADLVNGIDYFLEISGFGDVLEGADLVITGEGSIDRQTVDGKAPYGVAVASRKAAIPVIALAGKVPADDRALLSKWFDQVININDGRPDPASYIRNTASHLVLAARALGEKLASQAQ